MQVPFARRMARVQPSAIRELLQLGADPSVISFGGGYPDSSLFPIEELQAVAQEVLAERGESVLQYTVSNGAPELRAQIAGRMRAEGVVCSPDEVLVLHGGQQGLDLAAKLFVDRGDLIVTENPTFLGALLAFNPYEPEYMAVPVDSDGMDVAQLERMLRERPGARLLYTVPDFHNPTGVTMSLPRRRRLVELASEHNFVILEDTPYREVRFEGEPLPPLKSMDTEGRVIYLGSFSKVLAPGLRLGWSVASEELMRQLGLLKLAADTQCSTLNMAVASRYMERYDIDAHVRTLREAYRRKKRLMLDTIRRTFPADVTATDPAGGLFTWLTFPGGPQGFDAAEFMRDEALPKARVAFVPGATFFPLRQEPNHARVNYSAQPDERIVQGVTALGELLSARLGA